MQRRFQGRPHQRGHPKGAPVPTPSEQPFNLVNPQGSSSYVDKVKQRLKQPLSAIAKERLNDETTCFIIITKLDLDAIRLQLVKDIITVARNNDLDPALSSPS